MSAPVTPDERVLVRVPVFGRAPDRLLDLRPRLEPLPFEGQRAQHLPPSGLGSSCWRLAPSRRGRRQCCPAAARCRAARSLPLRVNSGAHAGAEPGLLLAPLQTFGEQDFADPGHKLACDLAALHADAPLLAQVGDKTVQRPRGERQTEISGPAQGGGDHCGSLLGRVGRRALRAHALRNPLPTRTRQVSRSLKALTGCTTKNVVCKRTSPAGLEKIGRPCGSAMPGSARAIRIRISTLNMTASGSSCFSHCKQGATSASPLLRSVSGLVRSFSAIAGRKRPGSRPGGVGVRAPTLTSPGPPRPRPAATPRSPRQLRPRDQGRRIRAFGPATFSPAAAPSRG